MENMEIRSRPPKQMSASPTKEELQAKVKRLEAHVTQLQNILNRSRAPSKAENKKTKIFDFSKYSKRHILLKFLYLGWDWQGYAVQEETSATIEAALFDALYLTKLVESRETSNYHRCGRTDKGVSAFSQVVSITVRSKLKSGVGVEPPQMTEKNETLLKDCDLQEELNYPGILNRVLPPDIRAIAWCPVDPSVSARFDCTSRTYKYFFPRGELNIQYMKEASQYLVGQHDFRNLCKMDVGNGVINYKRSIKSVEFAPVDINPGPYQMMMATIEGRAFLWHQIRAIMTVLFLVGEGKEQPDIIQKLLDVDSLPKKPQYGLASEIPLNLFSTEYEGVQWIVDHENLVFVQKHLQSLWTQQAVRAAMVKTMTDHLSLLIPELAEETFTQSLTNDCFPKSYKPLLERLTGKALEEQIERFKKRRRIDQNLEI